MSLIFGETATAVRSKLLYF